MQKNNRVGQKTIVLFLTRFIFVFTPHQSRGKPNRRSISFDSFNYSNVLGIGESPPRFVVNVHPASAHTHDVDCPAIHVDFIIVERRDGHLGGSALGPPLNQ